MQLGFAYAGSSLPALSTHGFATACLLNLMRSGPVVDPPDLQLVHNWISRIAESYVRDIAACFEFLFFGFCPSTARYRAFHFCAKEIGQSLSIASCERRLSNRQEIIAIGSGAPKFQRRFDELVGEGDSFKTTSRLPRAVVEEMIRDPSRPDVGGDVQIAYANRAGLQRLQSVVPISPRSPFPRITFLGQDIQDFGQIGTFFIGMPGLA
jgi:hypothetical protein